MNTFPISQLLNCVHDNFQQPQLRDAAPRTVRGDHSFFSVALPLTISLPLHRVRTFPVLHSGVPQGPHIQIPAPRGEDVSSSFTFLDWYPESNLIGHTFVSSQPRCQTRRHGKGCTVPSALRPLSGLVLFLAKGVFSPFTPTFF